MFPCFTFESLARSLNAPSRFQDGELTVGEQLLEELFAPHSRAWFLACRAYAQGGPGLEVDPILQEFLGTLEPYQRQIAVLHVRCAERVRADARPADLWREEVRRLAEEASVSVGLVRDLVAEFRDAVEPRSNGNFVTGGTRSYRRTQHLCALLVERELSPTAVKLVGVVASLGFDLVPEGSGEFYPATELAFVARDEHFRESEQNAVSYLRAHGYWPAQHDVRWHLTRRDDSHVTLRVAGASLGGCFGMGLMKLVADDHPELAWISRLPVAGMAITAALDADGTLAPVEATAIKLDAAAERRNFGQVYTVIMAEHQSVHSLGLVPQEGERQIFKDLHVDFHVLKARNLEDAFKLLDADLCARWRGIDCALPERNRRFVGRERLFAAVRQFLQATDSGFLVLEADMGKGKSSFITEFVHRQIDAGESPVYHFVSSTSSATSDPARIAACFYDRLRHKHRIEEMPTWAGMTAQQKLEQVLNLVSRKVLDEGRKEVLYLEAADQLALPHGRTLIPAFLCQLPQGILCVATVRPIGRLLLTGEQVTRWAIDDYVDDREDIRLFLTQQATTVEPPLTEPFIEDILSQHPPPVFFTVAACLRKLLDSAIPAARRSEIRCHPAEWTCPPAELISREIDRRFQHAMGEGIGENDFWTTLGFIAVAEEPISTEVLLGLGLLPCRERDRVLALCAGLFAAPSGPPQACRTYAFAHPGYVREVVARMRPPFLQYCHELLANGCQQAWQKPENPAHRYALEHLPAHLRGGQCWEELYQVLTNFAFLEKALQSPGATGNTRAPDSESSRAPAPPPMDAFDLVAHFNRSAEALQLAEHPRVAEVHALGRVVAVRAHALKHDPSLLAQVAYNDLFCTWKSDTRLGSQIRAAADRHQSPWLKRLNAPVQAANPTVLRQLWGHEGAVITVAFSPTQGLLASGSRDRTVRVWDAHTGACLHIFRGHEHHVTSVAFLPDGSAVLSASRDGTVRIWSLNPRRPESKILRVAARDVLALAVSPDGSMIATGGAGDLSVSLWLLPTGSLVRTFQGHRAAVKALAFSPAGDELASGSEDRSVHIWRLSRPGHVVAYQDTWVDALAYSPTERVLISGGGLERGVIRFWNPETGECLRTLPGHSGGVRCLAFSPDGRRFASGSFDNTVLVRDSGTGAALPALGQANSINAVAFSTDGRTVATGSNDRVIRIWDASGDPNACRAELASDETAEASQSILYAIAFLTGGKLAITGGRHQQTGVWDVANGFRLGSFDGHSRDVTSVAISPDGQRVASGSFREVRVWSTEMARLQTVLQGHEDWVLAVAFSPDGQRIVTGSQDRKVMIWDAATGRWLLTLPGHTDKIRAVAFSPDGRLVASAGEENTVRIWDSESGLLLHSLVGHQGHVVTLAFFGNVPWLATGGSDETVLIWDVNTGHLLKRIEATGGEISALALSGDGQLIAAGCVESTVRVWDTNTGTLLASMNCADQVLALAFDPSPSPDGQLERPPRILRAADAGGGSHIPTFFVMEVVGLS